MNCYDDSGCSCSRMTMPSFTDSSCSTSALERQQKFPLGMGYVPQQTWQTPYSLEQGYRRGTIFPELDLPFLRGRCR